ncbi:MAG: hypothetical protein AAF806_15520 [Bacteroidota bacterium]
MNQEQINQYINNYLKNLRDMKVAEESTQHLRKVLKVVRIKAQETPVIAGDVCRNMYIIVQGGFVCRYIHEKTGAAKTINFYLDNLHPIMTCVDSYFLQTPTNCELKAIEDAIVLDIPKHDLDILRKKDTYFAQFYHQMVITAMVEENELKTKLIAYSSKEKYDFIIEELSSVIQRVPSKYIAEFCGISAEWLSKIKKQR